MTDIPIVPVPTPADIVATKTAAKATTTLEVGAIIVSALVILIFCISLGLMFLGYGRENSQLNIMLGAVMTAFGATVAYWLGNSSSNRSLQAQIAALTQMNSRQN